MHLLPILLVTWLFVCKSVAQQHDQAIIVLRCFSPKVTEGLSQGGLYRLKFTTAYPIYNGELGPWLSTYTHLSHFQLETLWGPYYGTTLIDVPLAQDRNDNGFADFFEIALPCSQTTEGWMIENQGLINTPVTVIWIRSAGSPIGSCKIIIPDLGEFNHSFQILEYIGTVSYTPTTSNVSVQLVATQTGMPERKFSGELKFVKAGTNSPNELELMPGLLTNQAGHSLTFTNWTFQRDQLRPTNYYGWFIFHDGEPETGSPDYKFWSVSIDDTNDCDQDTVPDLSDTPCMNTHAIKLSIAQTNHAIQLTVQGPPGHQFILLESSSIHNPQWSTNSQFTSTNTIHSIQIQLHDTATFFRVMMLD